MKPAAFKFRKSRYTSTYDALCPICPQTFRITLPNDLNERKSIYYQDGLTCPSCGEYIELWRFLDSITIFGSPTNIKPDASGAVKATKPKANQDWVSPYSNSYHSKTSN